MAKKIRAARHYQKDTDPILRLSRSAMKSIANDLRDAFDHFGEMVNVSAVKHAIQHRSDVKQTINWNHYRQVLRGVFTRIGKLRAAGGEYGANKINGAFRARGRKVRYRKDAPLDHAKATKDQANYRLATSGQVCGVCLMFMPPNRCTAVAGSIRPQDTCDFFKTARIKKAADDFTFDSFSPEAQAAVRDAQDRLIQQLEDDARDAIDTIISNGLTEGTSVDEIAADVRDMIGLTDTQAQAVLNYQTMLENLDPGALTRQLRNSDYDAALQDSIDSDTDLSATAIENMVDDYIANYLDYRAATIAQTESTRAANAGLQDAYSQAIERGALTDDAVTKQWLLGDSPCPICESIVDNNPEGIGVNEAFDSDDGPVDYPPVHPNCECSLDFVTDLTKVPDDEE